MSADRRTVSEMGRRCGSYWNRLASSGDSKSWGSVAVAYQVIKLFLFAPQRHCHCGIRAQAPAISNFLIRSWDPENHHSRAGDQLQHWFSERTSPQPGTPFTPTTIARVSQCNCSNWSLHCKSIKSRGPRCGVTHATRTASLTASLSQAFLGRFAPCRPAKRTRCDHTHYTLPHHDPHALL